jgi:hypothetical protein
MKIYFNFIFLLTMCPIEDLHVEFCYSTVVIEQQKPPLMQIVILGETRPAALEEYLPVTIIIHLHLVWRSFT